MGNHPDVPFESGSFTERLAGHSHVAYYPYPLDAPCQVLVPFVVDQLLIGQDVLDNPPVLALLAQSAHPIGSVFGQNAPAGNDVQIWQLDQITDAQQFPDVAHFVWSFRTDVLDAHHIDHAQVAPNHVLIPAGNYHSCPFGPPHPHDPAEPPAMERPATVKVAVIDSGWANKGPAKNLVSAHAYAEWLKPDATGVFAWTTPGAAPEKAPPDPAGVQRLGALTAHANFIVGLIARSCSSADIVVASHNAALVDADDGDPAIPTEASVARSLWNQRDRDLIHVGFAFPTLPDVPNDNAAIGPPSWSLQVVLDALEERHEPPYIVAPVGNQGCTIPQYPAAFGAKRKYRNVIGVGSFHDPSHASDFSNHGPWVRCSTAGEDVFSTFIDFGGEAEELDPQTGMHPGGFTGWASWSGTSFASPLVTGALAQGKADGNTLAQSWSNLIAGTASGLDMGYVLESLTPAPVP